MEKNGNSQRQDAGLLEKTINSRSIAAATVNNRRTSTAGSGGAVSSSAVKPGPSPANAISVNNNGAAHNTHKSPKKRRKVNHACVYCRRSHMTCDLERPCTRCIKRNIGHLCHDEPRDADSKKARSTQGTSVIDESETRSEAARSSIDQTRAALRALGQSSQFRGSTPNLHQGDPLQQLVQRSQGIQSSALNSNLNPFAGFNETWLNNPYHDMHNHHPNYMIPEVSHEFNLLNEFLNGSLLEDSLSPEETNQAFKQNSTSTNSNSGTNATNQGAGSEMGPGGYFSGSSAPGSGNVLPQNAISSGSMGPPATSDMQGSSTSRPVNPLLINQTDKTREYYLQAADPTGNESPEIRMEKLLEAKYKAGLLKPFNYSKGYSRLLKYLDDHVAASSKQKVLRQLDRFRPKFREKVEKLTDMHLVMIEVWFERQLMEYDRVFASMAVPACCWRRTGEIFRGNTEMAELLGIQVDQLRDGKTSLHEILTEESVVRYWEEFGTIAFDPEHDSLLTATSLQSPVDSESVTNCCFSFMIRRDEYKLPSLIVGNFLPHDP